jgi:hypothetical protein
MKENKNIKKRKRAMKENKNIKKVQKLLGEAFHLTLPDTDSRVAPLIPQLLKAKFRIELAAADVVVQRNHMSRSWTFYNLKKQVM